MGIAIVYAYPTQHLELKFDLQSHLEKLKDKDVVTIGDVNARSPVWSDMLENDRGANLLNFCVAQDIMIANDPN